MLEKNINELNSVTELLFIVVTPIDHDTNHASDKKK